MVNIGIIGTHQGKLHAKILKQFPSVKVFWLCGANLEKTKQIAKELNIPNATSEYKDILNDGNIDLVIIASPNHLHKKMFLDTINADKNIILEKPAGVDSKEIQNMMRAKDKANYSKLVIVDHEIRFNPYIQYIKALIKKGELGEVKRVKLSKFHGTNDGNNTYRTWEVKMNKGGGQVQLVGSHFIDTTRFILDFPEFTKGAISKRIVNPEKIMQDGTKATITAEDTFNAKLLFGDIKVDFHNSIFGDGHKTLELKIIGTKATLLYDDLVGLHKIEDGQTHKIEIEDELKEIFALGKSLITGSLKHLLHAVIKSLESGDTSKDFCTLEQAMENSLYLESCEIT